MSGGENPNAATSVSTRPREGKKRRRKSLPFSQVRKCRAQAARVLSKLLLAAREKRHGTSIKSLTLDARKIDFPSATHAIVCETVKVLPLLKVLINDVKMTENVVGDDENDVDDDGDIDIFVATMNRPNRLLINDGTGHFALSDAAWLSQQQRLSQSSAWGDVDGDGDLDVFVSNYTNWSPEWLETSPSAPTEPALDSLWINELPHELRPKNTKKK